MIPVAAPPHPFLPSLRTLLLAAAAMVGVKACDDPWPQPVPAVEQVTIDAALCYAAGAFLDEIGDTVRDAGAPLDDEPATAHHAFDDDDLCPWGPCNWRELIESGEATVCTVDNDRNIICPR